jgi:heterodisulfide reductase subunit A-like polyferredoxin
MIVGQPFVDFILEHHPSKSRRLTTAEAVELLEAEHRRGHIHAAYFKDAMLDRFYAICNCCKCCCGAVEVMTRHDIPMIASAGFVAQVNVERCAGCGSCQRTCAFDAIHVNGKAVVDWARCMGCGACEGKCPHSAIVLMRDEQKGVPLDVASIV